MTGLWTALLHSAEAEHNDEGYAGYLARARTRRGVAQTIMEFLVLWGGPSTARAFPLDGRKGTERNLARWYRLYHGRIDRLAKAKITDSDLKSFAPDIGDLFDSLRRLPQPKVGGKDRTFGSTGAGKALHLLLPDLCPIWDEEVVRSPLGLDEQAWSYLWLLRLEREILRRISEESRRADLEETVGAIVDAHRASVRGAEVPAREPVTKIIDEALYNPSFRSRARSLAAGFASLPW